MDQNEMYDTQAGMEDSSERLEKKEQLRAKVQALVSYYEDEKRRNEELTMELERLKAEQQQMQGMSGPIGPIGGPAPGAPFPSQRPQQANPYAPQPQGAFPTQQQPFPGMPGMPAPAPAEFSPQGPQGPGGYTLQSFGAQGQQPPQGMGMPPQGMPPQRPSMPPQFPQGQQPQNPYGAPSPPQGLFPPQGQQPPQGMGMPPFGQPQPPAPQPFGPGFGVPPQPGFGGPQGMYPPQPPAYQNQGLGLTENIGTVLQTITQVRAKLQQFEGMRGYGYPQQPTYVDYDTVVLLDKLYDQLGDLSRDLMQRR